LIQLHYWAEENFQQENPDSDNINSNSDHNNDHSDDNKDNPPLPPIQEEEEGQQPNPLTPLRQPHLQYRARAE